MKRVGMVAFVLSLVASALVVGIIGFDRGLSHAARDNFPQPDVVMLSCSSAPGATNIPITSFDTSARAPSVTLGASCADTLANFMDIGFAIQGASGDAAVFNYTVVRRPPGLR